METVVYVISVLCELCVPESVNFQVISEQVIRTANKVNMLTYLNDQRFTCEIVTVWTGVGTKTTGLGH